MLQIYKKHGCDTTGKLKLDIEEVEEYGCLHHALQKVKVHEYHGAKLDIMLSEWASHGM